MGRLTWVYSYGGNNVPIENRLRSDEGEKTEERCVIREQTAE
jgi:hypothetical protein